MNPSLLLLVPFLAAARAQQASPVEDVQRETQKPAAARQSQSQSAAASEEAAQQRQAAGEDVTFEQVLAHPDDPELNYRYARAQVRRGDVKGASATLERLLLLAPERTDVRLFYAFVLMRLDDLAEARRELETVLNSTLPEDVRREARHNLGLVLSRLRRNRFLGRLSAGVEYASNRNASPTSGTRLLNEAPIRLDEPSRRRPDAAFIGAAAAELRRDLGTQAGDEAFLGVDYYRAEQGTLKTLSLQAVTASAGADVKNGPWVLTPSAFYGSVELGHATLLKNGGASLRLLLRARRGLELWTEGRGTYDDYLNTPLVRIADQRRGPEWSLSAGVSKPVSPRLRLGASVLKTDKYAALRFNAYQRLVYAADAVFLPGQGVFVAGSAGWGSDQYQAADPAVSSTVRRDETLRLAAMVGVPLAGLSWRLRDAVWSTAYEHFRSRSNIANYEYFNNRVTMLVTYRWEAGF